MSCASCRSVFYFRTRHCRGIISDPVAAVFSVALCCCNPVLRHWRPSVWVEKLAKATVARCCVLLTWTKPKLQCSTVSPHPHLAGFTSLQLKSLSPGTAPSLAFNRMVVVRYRIAPEGRGSAAVTINQRLAAVRRLAHEAADSGLLSPELAAGIQRVKGAKQLGQRSGNWLSLEQSRKLAASAGGTGLPERRDHSRNRTGIIVCSRLLPSSDRGCPPHRRGLPRARSWPRQLRSLGRPSVQLFRSGNAPDRF